MIVLTGVAGFSQVFEQGSQVINLGFGLGNTSYFGSYYSGFLPSLSGSYEYGIVEIPMGSDLTGVISAGGYVGWCASKYGDIYGWGGDDYYLTTDIIIAARGNYHFIFHERLDTYAGIWVGVDVVSNKWKGDGDDPDVDFSNTGPAGGAYVGARWYFTDNFAAYSEIGYLISVFNAGVALRIK